MILIDKEIRKLCIESDRPLIFPFEENKLQGASYDVSMNSQLSIFKKSVQTIRLNDQGIINSLYETRDISNESYIMVPGEYILVHLHERVSIPSNLIAHIRPRTRFTRIGLLVSDQHCNPTYEGNLQIGLLNASPNAIEILPGMKIAQMVFEQLTDVPTKEKLYVNKSGAAYQGEREFRGAAFDIDEFSPEARRLFEKLIDITPVSED